ncbi:MAG: hypothetical protein WBM65_09300, partial [Sedimenticolaceae bacterium]
MTIGAKRLHFSGWCRLVSVLLFCGPLPGTVASEGEPPTSCEHCHSDQRNFVQYKKIFWYYRDWLNSPHHLNGLTCDDCHGGDPQASSMEDAHKGVLPVSDPRSQLFYRNQPETCGECHKKETKQFRESEHYKGLKDHVDAPTCSTCHEAMNRKPYYREMVENTCRICHYENNRDGLPMVAGKATEILHRLNVSKGYMNWTRIYYQSQGWPGDSKKFVQSLSRKYNAIIAQGHSFDLENTEQASIELLTELKAVYRKTADEVEA